jgi:MFS family permease
MLGGPLSVVIGFFLAGWLNEFYGWRATFLILGLPGFILALLSRFTLREPRRARPAADAATFQRAESADSSFDQPSLQEVCVTLWRNGTFRHVLLCFSVLTFFGNGIAQWQAAFFIRSYGLKTGELGTWFTLIYGVAGVLGLYLGGEWASRAAANDERLQLRTMAVIYAGFSVIAALIYLVPSYHWAFALLALWALAGSLTNGPLFAIIQTLVPARMRAMSIAITYLFANLIGMGLGPLAAGALSDALRPLFAEDSLRYALLLLCPGYFWSAWHAWQGSKTVARDLEAVNVNAGTHEVMRRQTADAESFRLRT